MPGVTTEQLSSVKAPGLIRHETNLSGLLPPATLHASEPEKLYFFFVKPRLVVDDTQENKANGASIKRKYSRFYSTD